MTGTSRRRRLGPAVLLLSGIAMAVPTCVGAADPSQITVIAPDRLLSGMVFLDPGGTYHQVWGIGDDQMIADLTFHLSAPADMAEPGPVVVFWQFQISVADAEFGDISSRLIGPPMVETSKPSCDPNGLCVVHLRASGPIAPALEAADLAWVHQTWVSITVTMVRTFHSGSFFQLVTPEFTDSVGGTLASPSTIDGPLLESAVIASTEVTPAEIPGTEFHIGGPPFDWSSEVAAALALTGTPRPESSKPTPIDGPTPDPSHGTDSVPTSEVALLAVALAAVATLLFRLRRGR